MAGVLEPVDRVLTRWASAHNPFFEGPRADLLSLLPFALLAAYLLHTGFERRPRPGVSDAAPDPRSR